MPSERKTPGAGVYENGRVEISLPGEPNGPAAFENDRLHIATDLETWREANRKVEALAAHYPHLADLHEHRDERHVHNVH